VPDRVLPSYSRGWAQISWKLSNARVPVMSWCARLASSRITWRSCTTSTWKPGFLLANGESDSGGLPPSTRVPISSQRWRRLFSMQLKTRSQLPLPL
jgi:hypothetical protein